MWFPGGILYPMAEETASGTAGLYAPDGDQARSAAAVEAEFQALVADIEAKAAGWPREDVSWPRGC